MADHNAMLTVIRRWWVKPLLRAMDCLPAVASLIGERRAIAVGELAFKIIANHGMLVRVTV